MRLLAILFTALQLLAAFWLAAVARHGPSGLAAAALAYLVAAVALTWWASHRGTLPLIAAGVLGLAAAPGVLLGLDALERQARERRVAATRVSDVRDEPILSRGREVGVRLSFAADGPMPALPDTLAPAPLLLSIEDTTYGSPWRGGREERTRHAYSLGALYRNAAEEFPPCPK